MNCQVFQFACIMNNGIITKLINKIRNASMIKLFEPALFHEYVLVLFFVNDYINQASHREGH